MGSDVCCALRLSLVSRVRGNDEGSRGNDGGRAGTPRFGDDRGFGKRKRLASAAGLPLRMGNHKGLLIRRVLFGGAGTVRYRSQR